MSGSAGNQRDFALDLIRIFAFLMVVSVHFFLNSGYYDIPVEGKCMYLLTYVRTFAMVCVPLFMILSGYLMSSKNIPLEKKSLLGFYAKLSKVLLTYFFATVAILIYIAVDSSENLTFRDCLFDLLGYEHYSWYINMYIGCYLLIPLLNKVWQAVDTKQGHRSIVLIFCLLTILPSIFNIYDFRTTDAFIKPWLTTSYCQIVPDWWNNLYPITYYYIGSYLKSHVDLKSLKTRNIFLLLFCFVVIAGTYNIWRSYSIEFVWGPWCAWGSFFNTVNSTLVFCLIGSLSIKTLPDIAGRTVVLISELTLGAYLVSWIGDQIFYSKWLASVWDVHIWVKYFLPIVGIVILLSLALSFCIHLFILACKKVTAMLKMKYRSM